MNTDNIQVMRNLIQWIESETGRSASFQIDFWVFAHREKEKIGYNLWVSGLINIITEDLSELIEQIDEIKQLCTQKREAA